MDKESMPTVSELMQEIVDDICDNYCKWWDYYCKSYKDVEDAEEHLLSDHCDNCPLNRL